MLLTDPTMRAVVVLQHPADRPAVAQPRPERVVLEQAPPVGRGQAVLEERGLQTVDRRVVREARLAQPRGRRRAAEAGPSDGRRSRARKVSGRDVRPRRPRFSRHTSGCLDELEIREAVQQRREGDLRLQPGQRRAEAEVRGPAERQMPVVGPLEVQPVGIGEAFRDPGCPPP